MRLLLRKPSKSWSETFVSVLREAGLEHFVEKIEHQVQLLKSGVMQDVVQGKTLRWLSES